ncbi:hypothetical protein EDC01DRAFT_631448 [Geopyxis carbonaria]|nr:hypothetical protein EDC01DRAFT_631448 [Geopyxis carbonaria]
MDSKIILSTDIALFEAIRDHNWEDDLQFQVINNSQNALQKIISQFPSGDADSITINAKCFYWKRNMGVAVDTEAFKRWLSNGGSLQPAFTVESTTTHNNFRSENGDDAPHSDAFSRIVKLIRAGEPIPGIREIPDIINKAPPSQSVRAERKKPWESTHNETEDRINVT